MPRPYSTDHFIVRGEKLFRRLLNRLEETHGSGNKAAKAMRISQPSFSRLRNQKAGGTVTHVTMVKLDRALRSVELGLGDDLNRCVMGTAGTQFWQRVYIPWCRERAGRFVHRSGPQWGRTHLKGVTPPVLVPTGKRWREKNRHADMVSTLDAMEHRQEAVEHEDDKRCREIWAQGVAALHARGISGARLKVALSRIAEPFAEYAASGYVEPRWQDLSPSERRGYLDRAFQQELLLLPRPHDRDKAWEVAETHRIKWRRPARQLLADGSAARSQERSRTAKGRRGKKK
jgi:hypothetical protein